MRTRRMIRDASVRSWTTAILGTIGACSVPAGAGPFPQSSSAPTVSAVTGTKAFPSASGYGAVSAGGRGGRIIPVTTLADSGPGSLRACIDASGPRVCVFRVNGTIRYTQRPPWITKPFLTIAGQTAPGGGITLAHGGGANGRTPLVIKGTHDVVIRHIRVRPNLPGGARESEDGITIEQSERVILDHVSASWARDELVNGYADNNNISITNSIFAYGVPPHDKCALLASDPVDAQRLSFIGNVCAHNGDRNPDLNFPRGSCVEVVNNIFYNADSRFAEIWEAFGGTPVSLVGNVFQAGLDTSASTVGIARDTRGSKGAAAIYLWDNEARGNFQAVTPNVAAVLQARPPCPLTAQPVKASQAFTNALARAGAYPRDAIDTLVVSDVRQGTGRVGTPPSGIPANPPATPYLDKDGDGMDDNWEHTHGADAVRSDPWDDANGNGISNFEEFLAYREGALAP